MLKDNFVNIDFLPLMIILRIKKKMKKSNGWRILKTDASSKINQKNATLKDDFVNIDFLPLMIILRIKKRMKKSNG